MAHPARWLKEALWALGSRLLALSRSASESGQWDLEALRTVLRQAATLLVMADDVPASAQLQATLGAATQSQGPPSADSLLMAAAQLLCWLDRQHAQQQARVHVELQLNGLLAACRATPTAAAGRPLAAALWSPRCELWWQLAGQLSLPAPAGNTLAQHGAHLLLLQWRLQVADEECALDGLPARAAGQALLTQWQQRLWQCLLSPDDTAGESSLSQRVLPALQVASQCLVLQHSGLSEPPAGVLPLAADALLAGQLWRRSRGAEAASLLPLMLRLLLLLQAAMTATPLAQPATVAAQRRELRAQLRQRQLRCRQHSEQLALRQLLLQERRLIRRQLGRQCQAAQEPQGQLVSAALLTALSRLSLNCYQAGDWHLYVAIDALRSLAGMALLSGQRWPPLLRAGLLHLRDADRALQPEQLPRAAIPCLELDLALQQWRQGPHGGAHMALQLAGRLQHLLSAATCWQQTARAQQCPAVGWLAERRTELQLLQQGASHFGVLRVAALAAVLEQLYQRLPDLERPLPQALCLLLARAHQRLQRMLDQAAAWQPVSPAAGLIAQLHRWLEVGPDAVREPGPDTLEESRQLNREMRRRLQRALRQQPSGHELLTLLGLLQSQHSALQRGKPQSSGEQCD